MFLIINRYEANKMKYMQNIFSKTSWLFLLLIILLAFVFNLWHINIDATPIKSPFSNEEVLVFQNKANRGDIHAIRCLYYHYVAVNNIDKQIYWSRKGSALGDSSSQYSLFTSTSISHNPEFREEGLSALKKSAMQNDYRAQSLLAGLYLSGDGVRKDIKEAIRWSKKAAKLGNTTSIMGLIDLLIKHDPNKDSLIEAYGWMLILYKRLSPDIAANVEYSREYKSIILSKISKFKIAEKDFLARAEIWANLNGKKVSMIDPANVDTYSCKYLKDKYKEGKQK
jgi:TPR repeat protein